MLTVTVDCWVKACPESSDTAADQLLWILF